MIIKYSYSVQQKQNSFSKYSVLTEFEQNITEYENAGEYTQKKNIHVALNLSGKVGWSGKSHRFESIIQRSNPDWKKIKHNSK
jgi:hypothetical protein